MSREWMVGDLALVTTKSGHEYRATYALAPGIDFFWSALDKRPSSALTDPDVDARPLVVIDPEDREQVDRLCKSLVQAMYAAGDKASAANGVHPETVATALREFTNPKPPEPTGLGAVVEDADGRHWVRHDNTPGSFPWVSPGRGVEGWSKIGAVRVLSEGVTP